MSDYIFPNKDYKFSPTDADLLGKLKAKVNQDEVGSKPIKDCNVYDFEPWSLPELEVTEKIKERYCYVLRKRKTAISAHRTVAGRGRWITHGNVKKICDKGEVIGHRQALIFKQDNGENTEWIMHEYTLPPIYDKHYKVVFQEMVLCRIRNSGHAKNKVVDCNGSVISYDSEERDGKRSTESSSSNQVFPTEQLRLYADQEMME